MTSTASCTEAGTEDFYGHLQLKGVVTVKRFANTEYYRNIPESNDYWQWWLPMIISLFLDISRANDILADSSSPHPPQVQWI